MKTKPICVFHLHELRCRNGGVYFLASDFLFLIYIMANIGEGAVNE